MSILLAVLVQSAPVWVGKFGSSGNVPAPWRVVRVGNAPPTTYRLATVNERPSVEARFDKSMALLARPISVDLKRTPVLCWRWFIDDVVGKGNIRTKNGNDFAARVYVGFDMPDSALDGVTKIKLKLARSMLGPNVPDAALTYVWDNHSAVGTALKSPFTSRQQIIVAQSGRERVGQWTTERVDVANDFSRAFSGKPGQAVMLAVASDGDNTKSTGRAGFGDLHFVARNEQCKT